MQCILTVQEPDGDGAVFRPAPGKVLKYASSPELFSVGTSGNTSEPARNRRAPATVGASAPLSGGRVSAGRASGALTNALRSRTPSRQPVEVRRSHHVVHPARAVRLSVDARLAAPAVGKEEQDVRSRRPPPPPRPAEAGRTTRDIFRESAAGVPALWPELAALSTKFARHGG